MEKNETSNLRFMTPAEVLKKAEEELIKESEDEIFRQMFECVDGCIKNGGLQFKTSAKITCELPNIVVDSETTEIALKNARKRIDTLLAESGWALMGDSLKKRSKGA